MNIIINGDSEAVEISTPTVAELLKVKDVSMPETVSVQLNGEFVKTEDFATTPVKEGDEVDFLYFMGGGR